MIVINDDKDMYCLLTNGNPGWVVWCFEGTKQNKGGWWFRLARDKNEHGCDSYDVPYPDQASARAAVDVAAQALENS